YPLPGHCRLAHEQEDNQPDSSLHTVLAPVPVTLLREGFSRHLERNLVFLASPSWIFHIGGVSVILPPPHKGRTGIISEIFETSLAIRQIQKCRPDLTGNYGVGIAVALIRGGGRAGSLTTARRPLLISHQKICPCRTDAFDICRSALFKNERTIRHGVECFAHVNTVRYAVRFHAGGNIYSIAPHIIREAHVADDPGCCMATMQSYP